MNQTSASDQDRGRRRTAAEPAGADNDARTAQPKHVPNPEPVKSDTQSALDAVGENVLRLLSSLTQLPSALRIEANGVSLHLEWPTATPSAPAVAPADAATATAAAAATTGAVDGGLNAMQAEASSPAGDYVRAPAVGVLFRAPSPGAKPFVEVGDSVVAGQQIAIVEVMKLMLPVNADCDGTVVEVLKDNGEPVEFEEPLFVIAPFNNA